jgi:hypothetical protein
MTQACCPNCRSRFSRASLGYPLFDISDPLPAVPTAVGAALPVPGAPQKQ